jgi:hypothetical protein
MSVGYSIHAPVQYRAARAQGFAIWVAGARLAA